MPLIFPRLCDPKNLDPLTSSGAYSPVRKGNNSPPLAELCARQNMNTARLIADSESDRDSGLDVVRGSA
jgi:hypothetical protein